jgi:hypothetical protein
MPHATRRFLSPMPFVEAQKIYDPEYPPGHRYCLKSTNLDEDEDVNVAWAHSVLAALEPHALDGAYLNFPGPARGRGGSRPQ